MLVHQRVVNAAQIDDYPKEEWQEKEISNWRTILTHNANVIGKPIDPAVLILGHFG